MTDQQAIERNRQYPHLSAETVAYYEGRNSVDFGGACQFTDHTLVAAFYRGRRSAQAENRLDADTEWNTDRDY